jgi:hypothetical protein
MENTVHRTIQALDFEKGLERVPDVLRAPFRNYYLKGEAPSGLAAALLSGSLVDTFDRAAGAGLTDEVPNLVQFLVDHLPWRAFGSVDNVSAWVRKGGLHGRSPLGRKSA